MLFVDLDRGVVETAADAEPTWALAGLSEVLPLLDAAHAQGKNLSLTKHAIRGLLAAVLPQARASTAVCAGRVKAS